jgi:hypothetical protein
MLIVHHMDRFKTFPPFQSLHRFKGGVSRASFQDGSNWQTLASLLPAAFSVFDTTVPQDDYSVMMTCFRLYSLIRLLAGYESYTIEVIAILQRIVNAYELASHVCDPAE